MTPQEILALSEPVEAVYTDCVAQLIENICKHLGTGKNLTTQQWEIRKLSELDALTNESIKIIQAHTGKSRAEIKRAIAEAMGIGVRDVESVLKGAVRAGAISGVGFTAEQSDALKNLLNSLVNQAEDRANLVNTVMLNSTRQRYVWAVQTTADEEARLIEKLMRARNADELEQQLGKVQQALNVATSSVEVGAESRVQALSRTVKQLAEEGITGYIDRGGHHWSPEAYMNMDIRTTVHNTYVQAQRERASEYGVDTFQITSHAGARPLCAPYQGKFYSWDGSSGILHDLYGNEHPYESIYNTSYGEPAGIFGINCGHDPVTFVDGYNIPRYEPTTDPEQNAKEYAESQKQRQLERNVRQAKLEAIAQDAAGNKEAFKTAAEKVRQANADYKAYCKETGRTPRNDRLQVYASPDGQGYNRSMSGKVTGTTRGWKPPESTPPENLTPKLVIPKFVPASTRQEAEQYAKRFANSVSYDRVSVDRANRINEELNTLTAKYPINRLEEINNRSKGVMSASWQRLNINPNKLGKTLDESEFNFKFNQKWEEAEIRTIKQKYPNKIPWDVQQRLERLERDQKFTRWGVCGSHEDKVQATVVHEYGHILSDQYIGMLNGELANPNLRTNWSIRNWNDKWKQLYNDSFENGDIFKISKYGSTNYREFFAESFAMYELGEELPRNIKSLLEEIIKNGIL